MSENVGLPMATAPFQTGVDKIVAARVSTIYESSDACPLVDWPYDGYYFAVDDETPTKIAKKFCVNADRLVKINRGDYSELRHNSKLKGGTRVLLPMRDLRWMIVRQIGKSRQDGKKKKYTVQDIDFHGHDGLFEDVDGKRIQEYPQLGNKYEKGEIVCALWPLADDATCAREPTNSENWMTVFYQAIFEGYVDRGKRAKLKYENDNYSLDHAEPEKFRTVPTCAIIKREKVDRKGVVHGQGWQYPFEMTEIRILDPMWGEDMGRRTFLWDSVTKQWHDHLDKNRRVTFRFVDGLGVGEGGAGTSDEEGGGQGMEVEYTGEGGGDVQTPPMSPPRYTEEEIIARCMRGEGGAQALDLYHMKDDLPGQSWAAGEEAGTEEERAEAKQKPCMAWWYLDAGGRTRLWTAGREVDVLREPAPYAVLW